MSRSRQRAHEPQSILGFEFMCSEIVKYGVCALKIQRALVGFDRVTLTYFLTLCLDQPLQFNFLFLKFFGLVTIYFDPT